MKARLLLLHSLIICCLATSAQETKHYIDTANMDMTVKPGDNFFRYANGQWLDKTKMPASKTSWGTAAIIREASINALKNILDRTLTISNPTRAERMIGNFYASGMDSIGIEQKGLLSLENDFDRIAALQTNADFIKEIAVARTKGIYSPLFPFYITPDDKDAIHYMIQIGQGGTSLPDRDYYLKDDERNAKIRKAYMAYLTDMYLLIGNDSTKAIANANTVFNIEKTLAQAQMSRVDLRDPIKTYNKLHIDSLNRQSRFINWNTFLQDLRITGRDSIVVTNPVFLKVADSIAGNTPIAQLKVYLQWYLLKINAAYLPDAFVKRSFEFNKTLSGQKENTPRWQKMSSLVDDKLGDLLSQVYVKEYFNAGAKKRMLKLVHNLEKAFAERIKKLSWMSDSTKQKALEKLAAFREKIGYPDKWEQYDGLVINKDDLIGNVRRCATWNYDNNLKKLNQEVDKDEWYMTASTVNAYYAPLNNEVAFPAAILQFPFFDPNADDAVNYGAIGAVIGHEMTHGFDDKGRQYDANGNLNDWWTATDANNFKAIADKIVKEFDGYTVLDTLHINGKLTLGENIADFGGLQIAYDAFKNTKQYKAGKKIDGLTPDQRFFLSWAQIWRSKKLPETVARLILTDTHSPEEHRCNAALSHMEAFYNAFNITPEDKMYKKPEERIVIW